MKILIVHSHGLGSNFMVKMGAQEALRQLNAPSSIEVGHGDIITASPEMIDLFIYGRDLAGDAERLGDILVLDNILDKAELRQKSSEKLQRLNMI